MLREGRLLASRWAVPFSYEGAFIISSILPCINQSGWEPAANMGSSVLLGICAVLLASLSSRCECRHIQVGVQARCCPDLYVLNLLLGICYCENDWFLFWEIVVVAS